MIRCITAFFILGLLWGIIYSFSDFIRKIFAVKFIDFIIDFLMLCVFAVSFFTCQLIFYNGQMRMQFLISSLVGLIIYLLTINRLLSPFCNKITSSLHRSFKSLTFRLKNSEKSLKKLLHLYK